MDVSGEECWPGPGRVVRGRRWAPADREVCLSAPSCPSPVPRPWEVFREDLPANH